jgi:NADPH:quinone reductase-like Zn-dependent oxidoreductase
LTQYGSPDVLQLQEVSQPIPKPNEVLIKVHATTVNFGDLMTRNFKHVSPRQFTMPAIFWLPARFAFGFNRPKIKILGSEFAGEVEAVGSAVTRFKQGDAVFGYRGPKMGADAQYLCVAEDSSVIAKPANLTYEEAATLPYGALTALSLLRKLPRYHEHIPYPHYGALTALSLLRKANLQPRQKVLINGASGAIGGAALQLAKHYFGAEVTAVCSTPRLGLVKALGADHVIDYTREDFTKGNETYDLIFDVPGKASFATCRKVLTPTGRYQAVSFKMKQVRQMLWTSRFGKQKVICALSSESLADLELIKQLVETGKLKAILDRCFPLEQTAAAHRYMEQGQRTGSVVITMAHSVHS